MYKLAINRPITTLMFVAALIVFGLISFSRMSVSLYPDVDFPIVTIRTTYAGADPKTVESRITDVIEEAVSGIDGIDTITSASAEGVSIVTVKFLLEKDIDVAANDVRDKIAAVKLPDDADKPLVSKLDIGAASVITLFVASRETAPRELMVLVDQKIKPKLERIRGVGAINIIGYRDRQIKIYPDPFLLGKYNISAQELSNIIARENIKKGGGKLISAKNELIIKTEADAKKIEELKKIKIKDSVRLGDIARVEDGLEDEKSYANIDGVPGVMLEVQKISGENTVEIISKVKKILPELSRLAGEKVELHLINDTSDFILKSIDDVKFDLIYGAILAVLIVFVFLRNATATIVSAMAIPTSIIGTFALMDYMGYDLNKMTLIGLTLSIGILIDDAIVVIENIYKKIEKGLDGLQAALEGVKEIAFSVLSISAMLLAVFVPVAFMSGIVGRFFNSFALTVAFAIIISYIVAMTLIPSLGARLLRGGESRFYRMTEPVFVAMDRFYVRILKTVLNYKYLTLVFVLAALAGSLTLFGQIGKEFVPAEDKSEFQINIKADSGISLQEMIKKCITIQEEVKKDPLVEYSTLSVGYGSRQEIHKALIYVKLVDISKRSVGQDDVIAHFRQKLKGRKDLFITVSNIPNIKGAGVSVPFQLVLKSDSLESLAQATEKLKKVLAQKEGIVDIDSSYDEGKPEFRISLLRENANRLGITAKDIADIVNTAFSGDQSISQYEEFGKEFDITMRFSDDYRSRIDDIKKIQIKAPNGQMVYLEGLVKIEEKTGPSVIDRMDRQRQTTLYADLYKIPLGDAVDYVRSRLGDVLPSDVAYRFTGFAEEMGNTVRSFGVAIVLTVILMYLILASLYESLVQPLIIMVALPLSIVGVLVALYLGGKTFNLFTMIGFMLLMGMVGKNGVLLVDFANRELKKGLGVDEALILAGEKRLRPILMTTFAMIFAMIPLALGHTAGAESKSPMAVAIIGGLVSSTFLTLLIVPVLYKILSPIDLWLRRHYERSLV